MWRESHICRLGVVRSAYDISVLRGVRFMSRPYDDPLSMPISWDFFATGSFAGRQREKILVVEDHPLLAELVCDIVRRSGMVPVGPAGRLHEACELAHERSIDGAVLDVKLGEDACFPAAKILQGRGIPFAFLTGYREPWLIPSEFRSVPLLRKPFNEQELKAMLVSLTSRHMKPRASDTMRGALASPHL